MKFLGNVDNGQQVSLDFADVLDSGGTLAFDLQRSWVRARNLDHKATYYIVSPCITTAYIYYTMAVGHDMWGN